MLTWDCTDDFTGWYYYPTCRLPWHRTRRWQRTLTAIKGPSTREMCSTSHPSCIFLQMDIEELQIRTHGQRMHLFLSTRSRSRFSNDVPSNGEEKPVYAYSSSRSRDACRGDSGIEMAYIIHELSFRLNVACVGMHVLPAIEASKIFCRMNPAIGNFRAGPFSQQVFQIVVVKQVNRSL